MTFDEDKDELIFKNGKRVYAYSGTIGLKPDGEIVYGYDGTIGEIGNHMSADMTVELCEHMVTVWQARLQQALAIASATPTPQDPT